MPAGATARACDSGSGSCSAWRIAPTSLSRRWELRGSPFYYTAPSSTYSLTAPTHVGATVATTTSTANVDLVRSLGADIMIEYKKQDFADVLRDYDVVLNSLDKVTLEK